MAEKDPREPGAGNLLLGYLLLGLQPIPVALIARYDVGAATAVFDRFLLSLVFVIGICLLRRRALKTAQPRMLVMRGVLGGGAVLLYFTSIQLAGVARGTLLNYTYPIWANLFAWGLGARPTRAFWVSLFIALIGVWFILVPETGLGMRGVGLGEVSGLMSAVLAGAAVLTIKELRRTDESLTVIASFSLFGMLMSLPFAPLSEMERLLRPEVVPYSLGIALLAFLGHVFFTRGYRGVSVQRATLLSLSVPLVAGVAGILALGEDLTGRFSFGALLVLGATGVALWGGRVAQKENVNAP